mmetsp:Transcript_3736/g.7319  ORF Transcript_3736/g.7319 Transcript_3736/m.7319 type:complete len:200 (+) Transcript_3736:259-858(+)
MDVVDAARVVVVHLSRDERHVVAPERLKLAHDAVLATLAVELDERHASPLSRSTAATNPLEHAQVHEPGFDAHHAHLVRSPLLAWARRHLVAKAMAVLPSARGVSRAVADLHQRLLRVHASVQHHHAILVKPVDPHVPLIEQVVFPGGLKRDHAAVSRGSVHGNLQSGRAHVATDIESNAPRLGKWVTRRVVFVVLELL